MIPANATDFTVALLDLNSTQYNGNVRTSMNDPRGLIAVARNDGNIARMFKKAYTGVANTINQNGWDLPVVYVVGGPANVAVAQIKVVVNYELTFSSNSFFNTLASPAAVENTAVQTGSNYVQRHTDAIIVGGTKELEKQTMSLATRFGGFLVRGALGAIGTYLGGPSGGAAAAGIGGAGYDMIMDVD